MQVCWRGVALYATMLLCSLYRYVRCGPLTIVACCLVIQGICFKPVDLNIAPTKFMQLHFNNLIHTFLFSFSNIGKQTKFYKSHLQNRQHTTLLHFYHITNFFPPPLNFSATPVGLLCLEKSQNSEMYKTQHNIFL
jgi:hypothetical protein